MTDTKANGVVETLEVTGLYDDGNTLAYFLDPQEAQEASTLHGFTGPAQTRLVKIKVVWVDGKAYPLGDYVLGGPVEARISSLGEYDKKLYDYALSWGLNPRKALLKVLK